MSDFKSLFQSTIQQAGARLKPFEDKTRDWLGEQADKVKASQAAGSVKKLEETLRAQLKWAVLSKKIEEALPKHVDFTALGDRLQAFAKTERFNQLIQAAVARLNLPTAGDFDGLKAEVETLKKGLASAQKKLQNRVLNKDFKALATRVERLEKAAKA